MDQYEKDKQAARIKVFDQLKEARSRARAALEAITEDDSTGPCGKGPFTGNTRESRRVVGLRIEFSATQGGAPEVGKTIRDLHISAWDFGNYLSGCLRARIKELDERMEKL